MTFAEFASVHAVTAITAGRAPYFGRSTIRCRWRWGVEWVHRHRDAVAEKSNPGRDRERLDGCQPYRAIRQDATTHEKEEN